VTWNPFVSARLPAAQAQSDALSCNFLRLYRVVCRQTELVSNLHGEYQQTEWLWPSPRLQTSHRRVPLSPGTHYSTRPTTCDKSTHKLISHFLSDAPLAARLICVYSRPSLCRQIDVFIDLYNSEKRLETKRRRHTSVSVLIARSDMGTTDLYEHCSIFAFRCNSLPICQQQFRY